MPWINVTSLLLGMLCWLLPAVFLLFHKKIPRRYWIYASAASLTACSLSLYLQMCYTDTLITGENWSALMDTYNAVVIAAGYLLLVGLVLNGVLLLVYSRRGK